MYIADMRIPEVLKSPAAQIAIAIIGGLTLVSLSAVANPGYGPVQGNIMITLGATLFISLMAWVNAGYDASLILNKQHINHPVRFIVRGIGALLFSFVSYRCLCWDMWATTLYQGALFWLLFDSFLSIKRGRAWNYISTWYGTSKLDLIFKGHWIPWFATKIIILLVSLWLLS